METTHFTSSMYIISNSSTGTAVSFGANDVFGSYVEIHPSIGADMYIVSVAVGFAGSVSFRMQIATGGVGSELSKATVTAKLTTNTVITLPVPLFIPAGSRVAARGANQTTGDVTGYVGLMCIPESAIVNPILSEVSNPTGKVAADAGNTATTFKTDLTQSVNDYWKAPSLIKFTSGDLINQTRRLATVNSYNGTTKFVTVESAFTAAPSGNDDFEIINQ